MTVTRRIALSVALAWAFTQTLLTTSAFWVARGSDASVLIFGSSPWIKALTLVAVGGTWTVSVVARDLNSGVRWMLRIAALTALGLSTHLIVFNGRRCALEEQWFNWECDRVRYNCADGIAVDWLVRRKAFGFVFENRHDHTEHLVFTGVWPWKVDIEEALVRH